MGPVTRVFASVGISIASGCGFATAATLALPEALLFFPVPLTVGAIVGLITSPAAVFALALPECRPSFGWVFGPTAAVAFMACIVGGPGLAILASGAVYVGLCGGVGGVAISRRKHLRWFHGNWCPFCGYDLAGLDTTTCPECGRDRTIRPRWRVPPEVMRP